LLPGEQVLFETRPSLLADSGLGVWATIILLALAGLLLVGGLADLAVVGSSSSSGGWALSGIGAVGVLLWGGILTVLLLSRRATAYALTDRRVLAVAGFWSSSFRFAERDQVRRLFRPFGTSSSIGFEVRAGGGPEERMSPTDRTIVWRGVRSTPATYEFVQAAFTLVAQRRAAELREAERRARILSERIVCAYCGNLVAFDPDVPPPKNCPRCAAPLPKAPAPLAPAPPSRLRRREDDLVALLRPAVGLAHDAIAWYRPMPVAWMLMLGLVAASDGLFAASGGGPLGTVAIATALLVVLPLTFVLWAQAIRKWATVVRTLRASLPKDSAWAAELLRPLRWRLGAAWAGIGLAPVALVLVVAAFLVGVAASTGGANPGAGATAALMGSLAAFVAALTFGQMALVTSLPRVAAGSDVPSIERDLSSGRRLAVLGLLAGFWPVGVVGLAFALALTTFPPFYAFLPGLVGPVLLYVGLQRTERALDRWESVADGLARPDTFGEEPDSPEAGGADGIGPTPTPWRRARLPALAALGTWAAAVAIVAALWASGVGLPASSPSSTVALPPLIVVARGTGWNIPGGQERSVNFTPGADGWLSGSFTVQGGVDAYIFTGAQWASWRTTGHLGGYQFAVDNVDSADFSLGASAQTHYYIVIIDDNQYLNAWVVWTSACAVDYDS
jgi:hypothetical protein